MKKAIIFTRYNPFEKNNGGKIYTSMVIETISAIFDKVEIYCPSSQSQYKKKKIKNIIIFFYKTKKYSSLKKILGTYPFSSYLNYSDDINFKIDANDHIFIDHMSSAWIIFKFNKLFHNNQKIIYITQNFELLAKYNVLINNILNIKFLFFHLIDYLKIYFFEKRILKKISLITTITNTDKIKYLKFNKYQKKICVLHPYQFQKNNKIIKNKTNSFCIITSTSWKNKTNNIIQFFKIFSNKYRFSGIIFYIYAKFNNQEKKKLKKIYPNIKFVNINNHGYIDTSIHKYGLILDNYKTGFKLKLFTYLANKNYVLGTTNSLYGMDIAKKYSLVSENFFELSKNIVKLSKSNPSLLSNFSYNSSLNKSYIQKNNINCLKTLLKI